jgi:hypothetical protein
MAELAARQKFKILEKEADPLGFQALLNFIDFWQPLPGRKLTATAADF